MVLRAFRLAFLWDFQGNEDKRFPGAPRDFQGPRKTQECPLEFFLFLSGDGVGLKTILATFGPLTLVGPHCPRNLSFWGNGNCQENQHEKRLTLMDAELM